MSCTCPTSRTRSNTVPTYPNDVPCVFTGPCPRTGPGRRFSSTFKPRALGIVSVPVRRLDQGADSLVRSRLVHWLVKRFSVCPDRLQCAVFWSIPRSRQGSTPGLVQLKRTGPICMTIPCKRRSRW
ncbi:unnamed protein product [Choristocarpus tenellus]